MIIVDRLTRSYGDTVAVQDASFTIQSGEIVGLLGHNGAGKTTLMKMMTGFLEPTDGVVQINGRPLEENRTAAQALIGYLPENTPVYPDMSVVDYLDYTASLRGMPVSDRPAAIRDAVTATDLAERITQPIAELSRGLRQRVGVAQAIIHRPRIVILDEPTNGLDPSQIKHMRALIRRLAETATVILSTHIMQEVEAVCDRVIIIDRGRVALDTPLADLRTSRTIGLTTTADGAAIEAALAGHQLAGSVTVQPAAMQPASARPETEQSVPAGAKDRALHEATVELVADAPLTANEASPLLARALIEAGHDLVALRPVTRDLETIFGQISRGDLGGDASDGQAPLQDAA